MAPAAHMSTGIEARQRRTSTERAPRAAVPAHLPANILARIDRLTDATGGPAAHWRWLGSKMQANGYPQISYRDTETGKRVTRNVHRVLMEIGTGRRLETAEFVLHARGSRPDNVNPAHLRIGSRSENFGDAVADGRSFKRLTASQVRLIDGMLRRGVTPENLAERFGVTRLAIRDILRGRTHTKITGRALTKGKGGRPRKRVLIALEVPTAPLPHNIDLPMLAGIAPAGEFSAGVTA